MRGDEQMAADLSGSLTAEPQQTLKGMVAS